jgi:acyl-CoA thioester hydrolase
MDIRVYYDDTDAGGVVYHSNYLKFCERARSEVFFAHGKTPAIDGGHFVVKHVEADFKKPARLGDLLHVKSVLLELHHASLHVRQIISRDGEIIFEMDSLLAFVKEGKPSRIDAATKMFFKAVFS